ncbi:hypothetical protein JS531_09560 [Bifidobacterium sp. CP2]|uniref:variant leucine-rich repeat-containing protein n=1 Tax=Bifidobacterium sp. CP2 TaxID=2809025 RepID=UPI001BDCACAE|nr:hypothetical protein [Bifidobacterium sp. CP2]MBT1182187.1 hypothetical protein [Bifidobacterium sp. CP2]
MVDYDAAVAAVQDPNADPILLAKIAYENPEFGANVAVNQRAYPGLLRWLAEFGDDRARETVAQMGYTVSDSPAGAHQPAAGAAAAAEQQAKPAQTGYADPYGAAPQGQPVQPAQQPADQYAAYAQPQQAQPAADAYADPYGAAPQGQPQQPTGQYAASSYVQPAQNPYGFTAEQARTTTDQMQMAEIAQKAPELYPALAQNPNLYEGLVQWLAQLNDPAVNAALATRK